MFNAVFKEGKRRRVVEIADVLAEEDRIGATKGDCVFQLAADGEAMTVVQRDERKWASGAL